MGWEETRVLVNECREFEQTRDDSAPYRGNILTREKRIDIRKRRLHGATDPALAALLIIFGGGGDIVKHSRAAVKVDEALDDAHTRAHVCI